MKTIEKTAAVQSLAKYAEQMEDSPLVITEHGRPIAALLPLPNTDMETVSLSSNAAFLDLIARSRARFQAEGGISSQEMRRRCGMSEDEGRREKGRRTKDEGRKSRGEG